MAHWQDCLVWPAVAALWLAALAYYLSQPYLSHDVGWALLATARLLDGAQLYRDIVEINPPLIFYSVVPPVALARFAGWSVDIVFVAYVLLLAALSLALAARILVHTEAIPERHRPAMLLAGCIALVVLPIGDFGQREHFATILILPYVVLAAARFDERDCNAGLAIAAGLLAGVGFAFKPYFVIVPAALALYLVVRRRSPTAAFQPEAIAAASLVCLYAAAVVIVHPAYVETIVPYGRLVYDAYAVPLLRILLRPEVPMLMLPLAAYLLARISGRAGRPLDAFAITAAGFFAAYLVQSKGWSYQLVPVAAFLWLAAATAALPLLERGGEAVRPRGNPLYTATLAAVLVSMVVSALLRGAYRNELAERVAPLARDLAPNGALYAFTSDVWVPFPLVGEAGLGWASRFPGQ